MNILRRYRPIILAFGILLLLFFVSRLYRLDDLPIFTDEALYIRWAQIAKNDPAWRFISLTDGKQPSFVWLTMIMMRFVEDPLLAGRLVSAFAGFASMVGLFFLGRELFRSKIIGLISSVLYLLYPMALVYDRMALYDSLVAMFAVWSLYLTVLLIRRLRLDVALILGIVAGGGLLTKTNAFFNIYLLPFSLLLFDVTKEMRLQRFLKWVGLASLATVLAYGFYSVLRLSPFFHIIDEKNTIFVYPLEEWIKHPFRFFISNWSGLWDWFLTYITWPILFVIIGSLFTFRSFIREKLLLLIWFLAPFAALALFGNNLYPRLIFFMTLSLLPLAAIVLWQLSLWIKKPLVLGACYLVLVALMLRADFLILTDFAHAPIPHSDLGQYINDWPAGGGIREAVNFFKREAQNGKIYIGTQGTFGLLPYALEIYLIDNPNITLVGFWPLADMPPKEVVEASKKMPTYFVFYQPCASCKSVGEAPPTWPVRTLFQMKKGENARYLTVYRLEL